MSLLLVQDYSSEEEEANLVCDTDDDVSQDEREAPLQKQIRPKTSGLPSPEGLFVEVTGPPEYLKSAASEPIRHRPRDIPHTYTQLNKSHPVSDPLARTAPLGSIVEAAAKSYDSHKQVRVDSDLVLNSKGSARAAPGPTLPVHDDVKPGCRSIVSAENAATTDVKRNRSKIKDKEKNKRMKGQSSHATWKSETEMQLRQQFD